MPWEFSDDVEEYAEQAWDLLAATPAANTIALTVVENVRAGRQWSSGPLLYGWYRDGPTTGAVSLTPPHELLLAVVPEGSVDELVTALRARLVDVPGVHADVSTAGRFAAAWTAGTSLRAATKMHVRLYGLDSLRVPTPPPSGRPRRAERSDIEVAAEFYRAFHAEADAGHAAGLDPAVRDRVEDGRMWLWEDDGTVVSLAARNRAAAGIARLGPVYTPPSHRRCGYGAAVTAACTQDSLDRDADNVVLFTDLANPTSNAIYQQIGYRPLRDFKVVAFAG